MVGIGGLVLLCMGGWYLRRWLGYAPVAVNEAETNTTGDSATGLLNDVRISETDVPPK
jgi:hypothetical protein